MNAEIVHELDIACPPDRVFAVLADFDGQERWLARSAAWKGTVEVSENPVRLGTTYREPTPQGDRIGRVTEFEPPRLLGFEQPMSLKPAGTIEIKMRITLEATAGGTRLRRAGMLGIPWFLSPLKPKIVGMTKAELVRTCSALKKYCESL
jgi:uncharacterized protein YndB with AHSA1/START domain